MNNKKFEALLEKTSNFINGKQSRFITACALITIIIIGYITFFTSPYWLPGKSNAEVTALGSVFEINEKRNVTFKRCDYDKQKKLMEVELLITNTEDNDSDYAVYITNKSGGRIKNISYEVIAESIEGLYVIDFSVKGSNSVLTMTVEKANKKKDDKEVRLVMTPQKAYQAEISGCKDILFYRMLDLKRNYERNEKQIKYYTAQIEKNLTEIQSTKSTIFNTEKNKIYMTPDEIKTANKDIENYEQSISNLKITNDEINRKIEKVRNDNKTIKKQIDELQEEI